VAFFHDTDSLMTQRIVVVTGATGALGTAVTQVFRDSGDTVVAVSRSSPDFPADLTDAAQVEAVLNRILERYGTIDVLAHAMGGFAGGSTVSETPLDLWNRMLTLNFQSALYVCRSVSPVMIRAGRGRIVAVGSRAGVQTAAGLSAYAASKAALNALIQTLAIELKDSGVTANVVLPSTIDTEANRSWGTPSDAARWVKPESVAGVIHWLASEAASDVNGALVPVYGRA
jgi:NAD(P)-dependent dehydrogenase (short-subunit alcohol dehydrogenase family)